MQHDSALFVPPNLAGGLDSEALGQSGVAYSPETAPAALQKPAQGPGPSLVIDLGGGAYDVWQPQEQRAQRRCASIRSLIRASERKAP